MVQGQNQTGRQSTVSKYIGGTVHLIAQSNEIADSDTATELSNKSQASITTSDSDWTTTVDNTAGTTTLENAAELSFGSQDGYTHTQTVIQNPSNNDEFIIAVEDSPNEFTGEQFFYPAGSLAFTLGGE